ncbi:MAG: radical SAM protein [Candidatus Omnitrophica bacterium]|nr:radical SAM protein [Candidatus Omnitrophota bacterium]
MREIQYKNFSLRTHNKNWQINKPNVCQFELTFSCDFHCLYCYSDCYNNPSHIKDELSTEAVKAILDKVYDAGCLWLCLTGGDPLKREDFLEIYAYAKQKGFIITIFTNGYSLTKSIADFLIDKPPFVVELTLNSVTKKTFEEISQLPDSHEKTFNNIKMLIKRKIPIKIKTMIIKNNFKEIPEIKDFVKSLGLKFEVSSFIHARLNQDASPCTLRISPEEAFSSNGGKLKSENKIKTNCLYKHQSNTKDKNYNKYLFRCAVGGGDGIYIDPYGKMLTCSCLRNSSIDILNKDIQEGVLRLFPKMQRRTFTPLENSLTGFTKYSPCRSCQIRDLCYSCPGHAFLEKGDMELPIEWFCQLAHLVAGKDNL